MRSSADFFSNGCSLYGELAAVILAGGSSSRFSVGGKESKIFADVFGTPLIARSLAPYVSCQSVEHIVIVAKRGDFDRINQIVLSFYPSPRKGFLFVEAGDSRAVSSKNGICFALDRIGGLKRILITDAARCFTAKSVVDGICASLCKSDNAITGLRREETFRIIRDGVITKSLKDSDMFEIQTPQGFNALKILKAYETCFDENAKDESEIYFSCYKDEPVNIVVGGLENAKVTRPDDLLLFRRFASAL